MVLGFLGHPVNLVNLVDLVVPLFLGLSDPCYPLGLDHLVDLDLLDSLADRVPLVDPVDLVPLVDPGYQDHLGFLARLESLAGLVRLGFLVDLVVPLFLDPLVPSILAIQ